LDEGEKRALVSAACSGDRASFDRLFAEHAPLLRKYVLSATGRPDDADDLVQETGVRALAALGSYDGRSAFSTWLHSIARHVSVDFIRRRIVRRRDIAPGAELDEVADDDPEASPLGRLVATERAAALRQALERIPERHRRALVLRCVEGLSCAEIGSLLGASANAVSIMIYRAKSELRELLEEVLDEGRP
jgi:RNA polymerase sigma-70 factor (ECF subfamily)